ncbi:hypothetical protein S40293_07842 [Stachybotrys chartarum IBT 40293]|nr:hypothetical protein S40293_07842 [Stachybotrys chartarum IBT 40293]
MTSTATSPASQSLNLVATCKQTRFDIKSPNYRELDIDGLTITLTPSAGKAKKSAGLEVLSNAKLNLKEGRRYALVGRNGSGKSTIGKRLIPGIPEETRIALLQQTRLTEETGEPAGTDPASSSVLQQVIEKATSQSTVEQEIKALSDGVGDSDPYAPVQALRSIQHERLLKRLFIHEKDARLRSGARGLQARKALVAFEKIVAESNAKLQQPAEDISTEALQAETQEAADMLADLQLQIEPTRLAQVESQAKRILTGLGFSETQMSRPLTSMSGGWHMRASLATVLLEETDIILLDEPTNFLDILGIMWLQHHIESLEDSDRPPTLVLISHDRDFISICTDLIILKDKQLTYFHGDLPTFEASQSERKLWLTKMKDAQDKQKAHIEKSIAANLKAGKANDDQNKLRQAKSRQKKLDDRWGLQVSARGGRFKLNRDLVGHHLTARDEIDVPQNERPVVMILPEPLELRFPGALVSLENVSFRYKGASTMVLQDVSLSVSLGDRIGILGQNGTGKSTLIRLLTETTSPSKGTATIHPRLKLGYYSQHAIEALQALGKSEPDLTALTLLTRDVDGSLNDGEVRGLLSAVGLAGRVVSDVPLSSLSGGQLVRCELARLFWQRPQCLILDEVTTHLDYETVSALRDAISDWEGAVVAVSHDRWFMRGAVEGQVEEDDDDDDGGDDEEETAPRRRIMYRLRGGKLVRLERGVDEFEEAMEKRVKKLLS